MNGVAMSALRAGAQLAAARGEPSQALPTTTSSCPFPHQTRSSVGFNEIPPSKWVTL